MTPYPPEAADPHGMLDALDRAINSARTARQAREDGQEAPNTPDPAVGDTPPNLSPQRGADALAAWRAAGGTSGPALDPITKAAAHPTSRSLAIAAKCYDCQGGDADPGWRWRIGNCDAPCPLVPVRPHQHLAGKPAPAAITEHAEATA